MAKSRNSPNQSAERSTAGSAEHRKQFRAWKGVSYMFLLARKKRGKSTLDPLEGWLELTILSCLLSFSMYKAP